MANVKDEWWMVDAEGRRIGWLYPEDLSAILEAHYDTPRWVTMFSKQFGLSRSTVDRWKDGHTPIPKNIAYLVLMMGQLRNNGIALPDMDAPWLPEGDGINARQSAQ